jgi:hypothetical protein
VSDLKQLCIRLSSAMVRQLDQDELANKLPGIDGAIKTEDQYVPGHILKWGEVHMLLSTIMLATKLAEEVESLKTTVAYWQNEASYAREAIREGKTWEMGQ